MRGLLILLVLFGSLTLLVSLYTFASWDPSSLQPSTPRLNQTAVATGRNVPLNVQNAIGGEPLWLELPNAPPIKLAVDRHGSAVAPKLAEGIYSVRIGNRSSGQLTVAQAVPPLPPMLEDGAVVTLRSGNYPTAVMCARPDAVGLIKEESAPMGTSVHVRKVPSRCALSEAGHALFWLESCSYPGLLLTHGSRDKALVRLGLPPAGDAPCDLSYMWQPLMPGLSGHDGTITLSTTLQAGGAVRPGRKPDTLVVRHAKGQLQLASWIGPADQLLASDASWTLDTPADSACPPAVSDDAQRSQQRSELHRPMARARLHITIGATGAKPSSSGVLSVDLHGHLVPTTVENFSRLCRGASANDGQKYQYAGSKMQRIIPGFMAQGGSTDGGYGKSSWGGKFADESFALSHEARGVLAMANAGEDTNGSQFFILSAKQPHLDGKHVVFGRLATDDGGASFTLLRDIEAVGSAKGTPAAQVTIESCEVEDL